MKFEIKQFVFHFLRRKNKLFTKSTYICSDFVFQEENSSTLKYFFPELLKLLLLSSSESQWAPF